MKKALPLLSAFVALAAALAWLAPAMQGDEKKPFPPFGKIDRIDPAFDKLIAPDAYLENLADGWDGPRGRSGSRPAATCSTPTSPRTASSNGRKARAKASFYTRAAA